MVARLPKVVVRSYKQSKSNNSDMLQRIDSNIYTHLYDVYTHTIFFPILLYS